jgi:hypothetical protein
MGFHEGVITGFLNRADKEILLESFSNFFLAHASGSPARGFLVAKAQKVKKTAGL